MAEKIWVSLTDGEDGQPAQKTIRYAGAGRSMDNEGMESAEISYKIGGIWQISGAYGQEGYTTYDLAEAGVTSEEGGPMLVREGLYIAVPPGKKFSRMEVVDVSETELEGTYDILPVPEPALETEELEFIKNEEIYGSDEIYPSVNAECTGREQVLGTECIHIFVYPMHYKPKSRKVSLTEEMKIKVWFEDDGLQKDCGENTSSGLVNNTFSSLMLGYSELYGTDNEEKPRMIIITTEELAYSMKIYEGVKNFRYNVETVLTKDIYEKYPDKDQDAAILAYLMDEYAKSKISYVIFGGDVDSIPTHKDSKGFASDSYYCTDGSTVIPRFALSRFPARNKGELNSQTDIASYYDRHYDDTIRHTEVFTTYNRDDYEQCKEYIASQMAAKPDFKINKCYDGKCAQSELIKAINGGAAFVNYRGHGSDTSWQSSNGLSVKDVPSLDVKTNTPIVLSIACNNNNLYVKECFGACWVRNQKSVAFLGASNPSYTTVNHYYDKYLWEAIYDKDISVIGDIYVWATLKLYQNNKGTTTEVNIREYLLLGDATADYLEDDTTHNIK